MKDSVFTICSTRWTGEVNCGVFGTFRCHLGFSERQLSIILDVAVQEGPRLQY